jgi:hypothetical protein
LTPALFGAAWAAEKGGCGLDLVDGVGALLSSMPVSRLSQPSNGLLPRPFAERNCNCPNPVQVSDPLRPATVCAFII